MCSSSPVATERTLTSKIISEAYQKNEKLVTDDISLIDLEKIKCKIIEGENYNIKITNAEDIKLAESILKIVK